jgi:glycosyltransferase involved in cell wall biosynthesis
LLLIPTVKRGIEPDVAADRHPTMDYQALQARLHADVLDHATMEADPSPLVRAARRVGVDVAFALHGFLRADRYDVVFSNGENIGIPLALLFKTRRRRPGHVLIGHRLSAPKKKIFLKALHGGMDAIFVYAASQHAYAERILGIPASKLHLIPFHADSSFYRPMPDIPVENHISSAGLEWRDYPTLIEAVRGLDIELRLAAASPWSKHEDETAARTLPPNVSARRYSYLELRQLYASSRFVVVPLYENDFQAGVTTMLEAMATGKAVIVTRTSGQRDVIEDGVNGLYVPPGDVNGWREAISQLLASPERAAALGARARETIVSQMSLDLWVERIAAVANHVAEERRQR